MGQLRQAQCPVGTKPGFTLRAKMLPPLLAGFTLSAVVVFAAASAAGAMLRSYFSVPTYLLVSLVLSLCAVTDLAFPRIRPTLFNRQTPRSLAARFPAPITGLLWGMDTGIVVSTFRASAASWASLILTFAGWGPWWAGAAYAAAFCAPLGVLVATYPVDGRADGRRGWQRRSTESMVEVLGRLVKYVRYAAAVTALVAVSVAVQSSF